MIPRPATKLLRALKKAQRNESDYVVLNLDTGYLYHAAGFYMQDVDEAISHKPRAHVKGNRDTLKKILDFLIIRGYIKRFGNSPSFQVTFDGWWNDSVNRHDALMLVLTHVAFPSIVAFITTVLTLFLTGL